MWGKRAVIPGAGAATLGVVVVAVLFGQAVVERIAHPRDETAFAAYLRDYFPGWAASDSPGVPAADRRWVEAHPEAVLAEGDAACAWLATQPKVPDLVPSGAASVGAMLTKYEQATKNTTGVDIDERSRSSIIVDAWAYLCHGTREAHTSPETTYDD